MAGIIDRVQAIDKRVSALEGEGLDESAVLTRIAKIFADFELEITMSYHKHQYRLCGSTVETVDPMGVPQRYFTFICGPNERI